jgi:hypothetical protein
MKKKLFLMGILACALVFVAILAGCGDLLHACSDKSECNDGDYTYCGDSSCESSEYYTIGGSRYYYTCDGVCDGD